MKKNNQRKMIKFFVIPCVLVLLWMALTSLYIINFDTSLSVLSYAHDRENVSNLTYHQLRKTDTISGTFKAEEMNLGIVSVKFQTFTRPLYRNEDYLLFRLKEKGASSWYYQNQYRVGLIYDVPVFPFGFPKIEDSKDKTYIFEIESLRGNGSNSVALSNRGQLFFSKYQFSKNFILNNKKEALRFAAKKFINSLATTDVRFSSFIYLLPLLFYLLLISPLGDTSRSKLNKFVLNNIFIYLRYFIAHELYWVIIGVVLLDIFVIQITNDVIYIVLVFLWIALLKTYKMTSKISFLVALFLLLLPPIFLLFDNPHVAEKGTIWAYLFLIAGVIQAMMEIKKIKL